MPGGRYVARDLRRKATEAERVLWERLRDRRVKDLKFVRQYTVGPFVADFCCRERRLIVELDGEIHETEQQSAYDQKRDAILRGHNYVVLRFTNHEVMTDLETVLGKIATVAAQEPSPWPRLKSLRS
jgi:very-short-patch-repair endonuclease